MSKKNSQYMGIDLLKYFKKTPELFWPILMVSPKMSYYYNSPLNIKNNSTIGSFEVGKLYKDIDGEYVLCFKKKYKKSIPLPGCWNLHFLCRAGRIKIITAAPSCVITTYKDNPEIIITLQTGETTTIP